MRVSVEVFQGLVGEKGFDFSNVRVGDVLNARVLEILEDMVLISVKGEKIAAKTDIQLQVNEQIKLIFQGLENGEIKLKIGSSLNEGSSHSNGIVNALEDMGLVPNDKNIEISQGLLNNKLPVDLSSLKVLDKILPEVSNSGFRDQLQQAITLLKMDLPITKEGIQVLANTSGNEVSELLKGIIENLLVIDGELAQDQDVGSTSKNISSALQNSEGLVNAKLEDVPLSKGNIAAPVIESEVNQAEDRGNVENTKALGSNSTLNSLAVDKDSIKLNELIQKFTEGFNVKGDSEEIKGAIEKVFRENTNIKLFELLDELSKVEKKELQQQQRVIPDTEKPESQVLEKISQTKTNVIDLVKGLARDTLMTLQDRPITENNNVYLNLPLNIDDTWYDTKIHINSDLDKESKTDFNKKVFVRIDVETKSLGSVGVKLEIVKKGVSCTVYVEGNDAYGIFNSSTNELKDMLLETYKDASVSVERITEGMVVLEEEKRDVKFSRLDFRI